MALEFSNAKLQKTKALEAAREVDPVEELAKDLPHLKTLQQVIWRIQKDALLRGHDVRFFDPYYRRDEMSVVKHRDAGYKQADGFQIDDDELINELNIVDLEEERGDPDQLSEIRRIPALMKRVLEMRSTRAEINAMYGREWPTKLTETGEGFAVHAIDREKIRSLPPPEDTTPIIIAPGYTVGPRAVRRNAVSLAELGRSVLTYGVPTNSESHDSSKTFPESATTYSKVHATALLRAMDVGEKALSDEPKKYDVIGYSFGAVATLMAAAAEPERFRNIVLINPAGLTHNVDPATLKKLQRFFPSIDFDQVNDKILKPIRYAARYRSLALDSKKHAQQVLKETGELTWREKLPTPGNIARALSELGEMDLSINKSAGLHEEFSAEMKEIGEKGGLKEALDIADAISWADLLPIIEYLESKGVRIAIMPGEDDPLFNVRSIERAGKMTNTDTFTIAGGHAHMGFYPGAVAELCIDAFEHMKEKKAA